MIHHCRNTIIVNGYILLNVGARKKFADTIFEDLGGNESWGFDAPKIVIWDKRYNSYVMDGHLDSNSNKLKNFLKDYEAGKLKPYIKSEKPPKNNDGPVLEVVGTTFKEGIPFPSIYFLSMIFFVDRFLIFFIDFLKINNLKIIEKFESFLNFLCSGFGNRIIVQFVQNYAKKDNQKNYG
jgi:hypothetical protein